jgi:hypothetical protein
MRGKLSGLRQGSRGVLIEVFRRSIAFVLKAVWGNLAHREALKKETQCDARSITFFDRDAYIP